MRINKKLTAMMLITFCFYLTLSASNINLNLENVTVRSAIETLQQEYGYAIVFSSDAVDTQRIVSVHSENGSVRDVVQQILYGQNLTFEVNNRNVIVRSVGTVAALPAAQAANTITVRGTVVDDFGDPLMGAVVVVQENRTIGTSTNLDGEFTLSNVPPHGHLIVSFTGFSEQTIPVNGRTEINVMLVEGEVLEELVVVGMGRQRRESVVGAITTIDPSELRVPSASLSSAFAGRLAGVISVQRSGEPGADGANFWIRGISSFAGNNDPLIFIDGIEASIATMNSLPSEVIENFSVLMDATATALYGARGANGVILITTRTGGFNEQVTVNVRVEGSMTQPTQMVRFADGPTWMEYFNEALITRGQPARFPQNEIDIRRAGDACPFIFPNVDWMDFMFRDWAFNQTANVNVRGGADRVSYFMNVQFINEQGMLNNDPNNRFTNNINLQRYTMHGNIVSMLSPTTRATLRLNSIITNRHGSSTGVGTIYSHMNTAPGVFFPPYFPVQPGDEHVRFGNLLGGPEGGFFHNPYASMVRGYQRWSENLNTVGFELRQDLSTVTEGLSIVGLTSFRNLSRTTIVRFFNPFFYMVRSFEPDHSSYYLGGPINVGGQSLNFNAPVYGNRDINFQVTLNYERTFNNVHEVGGMLTYMQREWNPMQPGNFIASLPNRSQGMAARVTYGFDRRYLVEFNFGYTGSENFEAGNRFGFFPSVAVGYNISQEAFWQPIEHIIPSLRFRASLGRVGNDQIGADGRFPYLSDVRMGQRPYRFGNNWQNPRSGANIERYGAFGATWEMGTMRNVGMSLNLLHAFDLSVDVYSETRSGIFMRHRTFPIEGGVVGGNVPFANLGVVDSRGMDLTANYMLSLPNGLRVNFRGTFTYAVNELVDRDEPAGTDPWRSDIGRPLHSVQGLRVIGLFRDWDEIANSPTQSLGSVPMPGDIRYMSMSGGDMIDGNDVTFIGHPTVPQIVFGGGFSAEYRNFDFAAFFQGVGRVSIMKGNVNPFSVNYSQMFDWMVGNVWTEANPNPSAKYPRLARATWGQHNNFRASEQWLRNGAFVRLKDVEVGYTHRNVRFYLSGRNLLTWSPFTYWDPEQSTGVNPNNNGMAYPPLRVFAAGIQVQF